MEDINLHFTGDAHAVSAGHNLLSAFVDNHLFHGNVLKLDPQRLRWPRTLGVSDRALRDIVLNAEENPRHGQFVITEASEIMAVLALATDHADLRRRLGRILVGLTESGAMTMAEAFGCVGSMAVLLKDALLPNLVQTLEGTPAFVHAGPFGNIAHGNCSVVSDQLALRCAGMSSLKRGSAATWAPKSFQY